MDFPIFKEIFYDPVKINNVYEFFEYNIDFSTPIFIDVGPLSYEEVNKLIHELKSFYKANNRSLNIPYPLFLVGEILSRYHFEWRNFVFSREELPTYFRRKIYLKNTDQIKELKKFLIYEYGISEQDVNETANKLTSYNNLFSQLKNKKIENLKLGNILKSFK